MSPLLADIVAKSQIAGANFSAVKKSDRRPPVDVASITLPRSPASLSSGDEVPHIFTRNSRVQPKEILITSATANAIGGDSSASRRAGGAATATADATTSPVGIGIANANRRANC